MANTLMSANGRELDSKGKANYLYLEQDVYEIQEDGTTQIVLFLENETTDLLSFEMSIELPDGYKIKENSRGILLIEGNISGYDSKAYGYTISGRYREDEGIYKIVGTNLSGLPLLDGKDWLLKFTVEATGSDIQARSGSSGRIFDILFAAMSDNYVGHEMPDIAFEIRKSDQSSAVDLATESQARVSVSGHVVMIAGAKAGARVTITDMSGKILYDGTAADGNATIDVRDAGVYVITVEGEPNSWKVLVP